MVTDTRIDRNQEIFRELMNAFARPGSLAAITPSSAGLLTDVLDVLLDHEVSFCVPGKNKESMEPEITAMTGSRASDIGSADFVIFAAGDTGDELYKVKRGSLEYPDKGATVIYYGAALDENKKIAEHSFKGPGIAAGTGFTAPGIPAGELKKLSKINSEYPLGVDTVIISENNILCIPRSSKIAAVK
jgi:alpha-D-ribose 1-methylphosphonate 5-triphosphate synthase subunit PhnH